MSKTYTRNSQRLVGFLVTNNEAQQRLLLEDALRRAKARDQEKRDAAKRRHALTDREI